MGNTQTSIGAKENKWFLVLSNLSYLLPAGVTTYKMFKPHGRQMNKMDGTELNVLFLFVTFFSSWSYHTCRGDVAIQTGQDPEEIEAHIPPENLCKDCPNTTSMTWTCALPGSKHDTSLLVAKFIDHFLAIFTLFTVLTHVVPISEKFRKLLMIIGLVWMILFLSCGNDLFAGIPVFLAGLLLLGFWWKVRKQQKKQFFNRNKAWSLSLISTVLAFVFFKWDNEPYWLKHSLWHILGAVAGALLISQTASCYEGIDATQIKIPTWMQHMFTDPMVCRQYDKI